MSNWVRDVLIQWGVWVRSKGASFGSGGAVDLDRLAELTQGKRNPGEHSDPVLAELLSTELDGQNDMQRVHGFVLLCQPAVREMARLRYVGAVEVGQSTIGLGGPRGRQIPTYADGTIEIAEGHAPAFRVVEALWFSETGGGLSVAQIGRLTGLSSSTIYERLDTLHTTVREELKAAAKLRKKNARISPPRRLAA